MLQVVLSLFAFLSVVNGCSPGQTEAVISQPNAPSHTPSRILIKVGTSTFPATLQDNPTAAAFKALLPLTVSMTELNGNEKYADLPRRLPTSATNPGTIQNGDVMLYGSSTLVLFYKSFPTAYTYTRVGRVDNPAGLATALGSGNVKVTFELE